MKRINPEAPLTESQRNKRFYDNHRDDELARNRGYYGVYYRKNKDRILAVHRSRRHGLTQEQYDAKKLEQDNCCDICHKEFNGTPHIDHNHACCPNLRSCDKCRRGLLCKDCNLGLGRFKDSIEVLSNAIEYLKGYKQ
jgi:hypothetical protein